MLKKDIRTLYKEKRKMLSHKEISIFQDLLLIQFQKFSFENIDTVLSYMPMLQNQEPDPENLIAYLKFQLPELQIGVPVSDFENNSMKIVAIHEDTQYTTSAWGITEPVNGDIISPELIDLVLVPLLAFDSKGYRVGYGKGFYDRFFQKCNKDILKIGISFFDPIDHIDDVALTDIPLDHCITPHQVYSFAHD